MPARKRLRYFLGLTSASRTRNYLRRNFRVCLQRDWPSQRRVKNFSRKLCRPARHGVKSFVKPVRATIIISLRGLAHNHRLYTHNNTFAAYPRSPNYYRDGNDRNSSERGPSCNLLRGLYYALHTCAYIHTCSFSASQKRKREAALRTVLLADNVSILE